MSGFMSWETGPLAKSSLGARGAEWSFGALAGGPRLAFPHQEGPLPMLWPQVSGDPP